MMCIKHRLAHGLPPSFSTPPSFCRNPNTQRPGWAYTWDAHNRLRSAAPASPQAGATRLTFAYDGRNRCAVRRNYTWTEGAWVLAANLYLTYSDWNLIEERDAEGTLAAAYVHGPAVDDVLARLTPTGTLYYHADAQHNTVAVTDSQATVLERYTYDIFGLPTVRDAVTYATLSGTTVGNRFLFQGREWLAEVKLTDHRNRLYSPEMHRWLNRDPIGENGGINLVGFVGNDPIANIDPLGQSALLCATAMIVIGGIILYYVVNASDPPGPVPTPAQVAAILAAAWAKPTPAQCTAFCSQAFGTLGGTYPSVSNFNACNTNCSSIPVP